MRQPWTTTCRPFQDTTLSAILVPAAGLLSLHAPYANMPKGDSLTEIRFSADIGRQAGRDDAKMARGIASGRRPCGTVHYACWPTCRLMKPRIV